ncbi:uncharacterized protein LOC124846970 [Vigna umbellata]|uniref:uncharacterized protein LOC124846970 n=1 Tax=Vigna umbellata TaxID=87088 RepID=UPI001F5FB8F7|nr:uncharacterized protein LOC124846970 [Vigna umbellata]
MCGGPHLQSACPQMVGFKRCNICSRDGHYPRDCPTVKRVGSQTHQAGRSIQRGGDRPQAAGRVYALTGAEAASLGNLIIGCSLLFGKPCCVLFDSGATHFFVPESCVEDLGLAVRELQYDLTVSTPTSGLVKTSTVCARCSVVVEGRQFKVNLICLPLQGLEVILGIDWLSANRILIDCGEKKLLFPEVEEPTFFSSGQLRQELARGSVCFMVLTHLEVE